MNKIMLAMVLAGMAVSVQAAPTLTSDVAEAAATVTAPNRVMVSNVLTPSTDLKTGVDVVMADVARGSLSADDGLPHSYAVTFPDDIINTSSDQVRATVTGTNNPANKMEIQLGERDSASPVSGTLINGKRYLLLANQDGNSEVGYGVYTIAAPQNIKPDTYNIRTQAYIYAE
ncbi:hypothetical protein SNN83_004418 [Cronobacter malonaticus]|jgi:hypothetical protein|nr:hypothetical protein [Cronobacter malonaticus]